MATKKKVTFKGVVNSIWTGIKTIGKVIAIVGLAIGIVFVIIKILSSKNGNKGSIIVKMFAANEVTDKKKAAALKAAKGVDKVVGHMVNNIDKSKEFLNG